MSAKLTRGRFGGVALALVLSLLAFAPAAQAVAAANDDVGSATAISALPFADSLDTSDATTAPDDPSCAGSGHTVWFAWTPGADARVEANTFGSSYDTTLSVYTGARGALSQLVCNDDSGGLQSRLEWQASAGTTYYVMVASYGGGPGGSLSLSVHEAAPPPPPPNDDFAGAGTIGALPFTDQVDTSGATTQQGEPVPSCAPGSLQGTLWYAYTPSQSGSVIATG